MSEVTNIKPFKYGVQATIQYSHEEVVGDTNDMSQIRHVGKVFILGKQGRDVCKISESQLLECLEILRKESEDSAGEARRLLDWNDIIEYLQDQKE